MQLPMATTRSTKSTKPRVAKSDGRRGSKPPAKTPEKPLSLAEIGREAAKKAQREALLATLERLDWNLSATAEELGLSNTSNVIRSIRALDLDTEYEAARDAGRIPKGPRG